MKKHLLYIPFMALLATSCGEGHITTTPVINAPSMGILNAQKGSKKGLYHPNGDNSVPFNFTFSSVPETGWYNLDGTVWTTGEVATIRFSYSGNDLYATLWFGNTYRLSFEDYVSQADYDGMRYYPDTFAPFGCYQVRSYPCYLQGVFHYKPADHAYQNGYDVGEQEGYQEGRQEGYESGYNAGMTDVYNVETNKLIPNGQYTGLSIFPKRKYLEDLAPRVVSHLTTLEDGEFYLIDTNGNYTIYIKWHYAYPKTTFQGSGNTVIGELYWDKIISKDWSTSWFYKYDAETHMFARPQTFLTDGPIDTSFYPEVYLGSTFTGGDANLYFSGGGNGYQMGFADGQTYTIHASETYQNVFTIFTPAFRAVADFFNLSIGPFKVWYFFAIPLIVTLLILVLRLVKH